ncbi:MAG: hypothetical protein RIE58_02295 [Vicingaceae bacterium]
MKNQQINPEGLWQIDNEDEFIRIRRKEGQADCFTIEGKTNKGIETIDNDAQLFITNASHIHVAKSSFFVGSDILVKNLEHFTNNNRSFKKVASNARMTWN